MKRKDLTGNVYGELTVLEYSHNDPETRSAMWSCRCSCGEVKAIYGYALEHGHYKSCGCRRDKKRDAGVKKHIKKDSVDGTRISALNAKLHVRNKSGHKGVSWVESRQKWSAYIGFKGKQISLGYFKNKDEAIAARRFAEERYHEPIKKNKNRKLKDLTGDKYGRLTVLHETKRKGRLRQWFCKCECGNETIVLMSNLTRKNNPTNSCGCLHKEKVSESRFIDITGQKFGYLKVLDRVENNQNYATTRWLCECECGNTKVVYKNHLTSGDTISCGCKVGRPKKSDRPN